MTAPDTDGKRTSTIYNGPWAFPRRRGKPNPHDNTGDAPSGLCTFRKLFTIASPLACLSEESRAAVSLGISSYPRYAELRIGEGGPDLGFPPAGRRRLGARQSKTPRGTNTRRRATLHSPTGRFREGSGLGFPLLACNQRRLHTICCINHAPARGYGIRSRVKRH